jgi:hypothetical protein
MHGATIKIQGQELCTDRGKAIGEQTIERMEVGCNGLMIQSSPNRVMTKWSANKKPKVAAVHSLIRLSP